MKRRFSAGHVFLCIVLGLLLLGPVAGCDYVRPLIKAIPFLGGSSTATPITPTRTPMPTLTQQAATETPTPEEPTPEPTATLMTGVLDAAYVRDVSIPDGTVMAPGESFTKTWEIENTGEIPWPAGTELRRVEGAAMGPLESVSLNAREAGERAEIAVELEAPQEPGTYRGYWQLCVGESCFGSRFFVEIRVQAG